MSTKGEIKARLEKLQKIAREEGKPKPYEVARAQMYFHEHGGQWPRTQAPKRLKWLKP